MSFLILQGDWIERLKELPDESVHCCVTSPPYFGLRDYGTAKWEGGDPACDHRNGRPGAGRADGIVDERMQRNRDGAGAMAGDCRKCGATRKDQQLGLERTPEKYVAKMVEGFREVKRVLRSDGTCWLNLGDSYAGSWGNYGGQNRGNGSQRAIVTGSQAPNPAYDGLEQWRPPASEKLPGLKPKDLCGIPWMVAFALRSDGWWLRQEITWCKRAPMPESVRDRFTTATEKIFLLTKNERYFFDAEAVKEESVSDHPSGNGYKREPRLTYADDNGPRGNDEQWQVQPYRNRRNFWLLGPEPFPEAHFATFVTEIPRIAIMAGTSEKGCCPECGAPWERVTERSTRFESGSGKAGTPPNGKNGSDYEQATSGDYDIRMGPVVESRTIGWRPTCKCNAGVPVACTVLDPFNGAGTTGLVARRLGRNYIGIELNPQYVEMSGRRIQQDAPLFNTPGVFA